MSVYDFFVPPLTGLEPGQAKLIRGVSDELRSLYFKKELSDMAEKQILGPSQNERLDTEAKKLDIIMKKKTLGLQLNDDEYEGLVNKSLLPDLTKAGANLTIKNTRSSVMGVPQGFMKPAKAIPEWAYNLAGEAKKIPGKGSNILKDSINVIHGGINHGKSNGIAKLGKSFLSLFL